jgi:RNA polymerase sigma-70 factor, ECF subfamily
MSATSRIESDRLEAAQGGDERAFEALIAPFRGELHAHCYRMLGSVHDAEDALQEATLRAWKGLARFQGRSSLRSWLYTIATNTCLNHISRRPKRVLPVDYGPAADPHGGPGEPVVESVWIEPYPDESLGLEDVKAGPEARYAQRESIELAFVAALQHLPASQRAILILREVLGFSAKEVAETLDTTVASVNSGLQRARKSVEERTPEQSQQETLRELGDEALETIVKRYVDAWERDDVDAVVSMLTEDAAIAMPPLASWFGGNPDDMRAFLEGYPMSGIWHWKARITTANGQPAIGFYAWDEEEQKHKAFALNVLTFRGDKVADIVAFAVPSIESDVQGDYEHWPTMATDSARLEGMFGRFGLPETLDP